MISKYYCVCMLISKYALINSFNNIIKINDFLMSLLLKKLIDSLNPECLFYSGTSIHSLNQGHWWEIFDDRRCHVNLLIQTIIQRNPLIQRYDENKLIFFRTFIKRLLKRKAETMPWKKKYFLKVKPFKFFVKGFFNPFFTRDFFEKVCNFDWFFVYTC